MEGYLSLLRKRLERLRKGRQGSGPPPTAVDSADMCTL